MRKLASIQRILEIEPIKDAERIEKATVLGFHVVIKKDEFKVGDKIVYIETDSICPKTEDFEFLKNSNYRVRIACLRGQYSQGLIMPLSILPKNYYEEGMDVTDILGIEKYEPPIPACLDGIIDMQHYPASIPRSDETRVQLLQDVLTKYKGIKCYYSEKIDGTSSCFANLNGDLKVFGHNSSFLRNDNNVFWKVYDKYNLEDVLSENKNIAIHGETYGHSIQGNKYGIKNDFNFACFNVFDIEEQKFLNYTDFLLFCRKYNIPTVPILNDNFTLIDDIDALIELSKGKSSINPNINREGIVIRPLIEVPHVYDLGRLSFKCLNPDFLLKYKE